LDTSNNVQLVVSLVCLDRYFNKILINSYPEIQNVYKLLSLSPSASQQFFTAVLQNGGAGVTQTEKYRCKMNQVPFRHLHKICLTLDIKREADGRDVREFASKLNIPVPEFKRLQQAAEIQRTTTSSVILAQWVPSSWTVGDFVKIMNEMEREDIIDLINEWE